MDKQKISELQFQLLSEFRDHQSKYIYYIIALNVGALAFAINLTKDSKLAFTQIPLGLAVIFWSLSICSGIYFLKIGLNLLMTNNFVFELRLGKIDAYNESRDNIEDGVKIVKEQMNKLSAERDLKGKNQLTFLYLGSFCFVVWRVIEMFQHNTSLPNQSLPIH